MYHLDLDLSSDEVKQLKQLALDRDESVKGMVTQMVKSAIETKPIKANTVVSRKPSK